MRRSPHPLWLATLLGCALSCSHRSYPPTPVPAPMRERLVIQEKFRVAVFPFEFDQKSGHTTPRTTIPATLINLLKQQARFSVYEGGALGGGSLGADSAGQHVDGYFSGTITELRSNRACVEIRFSNAYTHEVLFADDKCIPVSTRNGVVSTDEAGAGELLAGLQDEDVFPVIDRALVLAADDRLVTINVGSAGKVQPGMIGFLSATGGRLEDNTRVAAAVDTMTGTSQEERRGSRVIVGEFYVLKVRKETSEALLFRGDYALPGDTAYFK